MLAGPAKIAPRKGKSAPDRPQSWRSYLLFGNLADVFLRVQRRIRWLIRDVAIRHRRKRVGGGFGIPQIEIDSFCYPTGSKPRPSGRGGGSVQAVN